VLLASSDDYACISVQRAPKQGHVQQRDIALMARIVPHVRQACEVARRLGEAGEAHHSLERALDWLADGVIVIGRDGTVVYANEAAQAISRRGDGVRLRNGAIELAAADARARLGAALAGVVRLRDGDAAAAAGSDFPVPRSAGAPPYLVSVRPLMDRERRYFGETTGIAIVFVRDPSSRNAAAIRVLREIFGLTEAEASLAQALQGGTPLAAYANARGLSLNTVYTHLRRVREKTGCTRMPELIRKLNDLQMPWRAD
jgi:DNA-binding CsgD family transcriptional regulator